VIYRIVLGVAVIVIFATGIRWLRGFWRRPSDL